MEIYIFCGYSVGQILVKSPLNENIYVKITWFLVSLRGLLMQEYGASAPSRCAF